MIVFLPLQVACFDTAFHQSMPPQAYTYALPHTLAKKHHLRKYGFHGTSVAYLVGAAARFLGRDVSSLNLIICHIGDSPLFIITFYQRDMTFEALETVQQRVAFFVFNTDEDWIPLQTISSSKFAENVSFLIDYLLDFFHPDDVRFTILTTHTQLLRTQIHSRKFEFFLDL